jgi:predicted DNA binding CopG/RHH family protein
MAKTADLRIRLEPGDLERIKARAEQERLPVAIHVRRILLADCEPLREASQQPDKDTQP